VVGCVSSVVLTDSARPGIYRLSLHDALPIYGRRLMPWRAIARDRHGTETAGNTGSSPFLSCRSLVQRGRSLPQRAQDDTQDRIRARNRRTRRGSAADDLCRVSGRLASSPPEGATSAGPLP